MKSITDFEEFLANEGPDTADELADLASCVAGANSAGRYSSKAGKDGSLIVSGSEFSIFLTDKAQFAFLQRLKRDVSEPGASFEGDAAFERAMAKND
ncbi:hypothetical protein [Caulobacter sp. RL271]|uniref:Uncharacterized protein n=1 Tax=Caulobacter segnis TaxID=88688 RepID=A0ABY4ZV36_9CAUL|nr:hypothetical protein [Caulobacter segnis]USQ95877.1 hypothetical protein MZV50_25625 [Caulobacter segnis]